MAKPIELQGKEHHYVARFTYGYTRKAAKQVTKKGGGPAWFESQLKPKKVKDKKADRMAAWYPSLKYSPTQLVKRDRDGVQGGYEVMQDLGRWTMMRRIHSNRQLHEMMVEFWSNLLHVPIETDDAWMYRVAYDRMIRKYALKRFDKMLIAATTHGAMGLFLDNAYSTKDAPNENLGREVLELHSVGVGNYTENHVLDSARLLTGYRIDLYRDDHTNPYQRYETADHYVGRVKIMGFSSANASADGRATTQAYLKYLAHHKKTSRRIAKRLCIRFVTDEPSKDMIKTVAKAYRKNKTKIKPTLKAMIEHPDFNKSKREKIRTPMEDTMGTLRALRPVIAKPRDPEQFGNDFGNSVLWVARNNGQSPYDWGGPDGYPETNPPWSSTGRVLHSMDFHRGMAMGWYGDSGLGYRAYTEWLPALPASFKKVVNRISLDLHGRKAPKKVRKAVSIRTGIKASASVTSEQVTEAVVQQILLTLLDSPNHLKR